MEAGIVAATAVALGDGVTAEAFSVGEAEAHPALPTTKASAKRLINRRRIILDIA